MIRLSLVSALLTVLPVGAHAQVATPPPTPPATAPAVPPAEPVDYIFSSGAGMLIFHVDPAKATDFDAVLLRVNEALKLADTATRKLQATNWHIYKSAEKADTTVVYLFVFEPALDKVSYDPLLLIAEVLPREVQPLFERMKAAIVRVERMGLTKIR